VRQRAEEFIVNFTKGLWNRMPGLNWFWIALELLVPPLIALAVAYPIWQQKQPILGNLAGTAVIVTVAVGLIGRESVQLDRLVRACLDNGIICAPSPSAFTRYAIYVVVAFIEIMALFTYSLSVEARIRRRGYAPEWR
jgi:hypothetical protein